MKKEFVLTSIFLEKFSKLIHETRLALNEHGKRGRFLCFSLMPTVFFKIFEEYLKKNNLTEENFIFDNGGDKKEFLKIMEEKRMLNEKFYQRLDTSKLALNSHKLRHNLNFLLIVIEEVLGKKKVKNFKNTYLVFFDEDEEGRLDKGEIDFKISGENISIHIDSEDFILTLIIPKDKVPFSTETKNGAHLLFFAKNLKKQE